MAGEFADFLLSLLSSRSEYAEVRFMREEGKSVSFNRGEYEGMDRSVSSGYAIRALNRSISMGGFIDREDRGGLARDVVEKVIRTSMKPGKNRIWVGKAVKDRWSAGTDTEMDTADMLSFVRDMDRHAMNEGAQVSTHAMSVGGRRFEHFVNTAGTDIEGEVVRTQYFYVIGVVEEGEFEQSFEQFGTTQGRRYFDGLSLMERISEDIRGGLRESTVAPRVERGGYFDVVVGPEISGIVAHESCGHPPTEYDRIVGREGGAQAGESFLTGKPIPYRIGSDSVTVVDDPTMEGSFGYYKYDDEGVPARKRYLYRHGMTNEFILNRESASLLGLESNGGGRSSAWNMEPPLARMSTTYIEPGGDHSFEELFEGISRGGIYIKSFTEWNIDDIRLHEKYVGKDAYLIERGGT